MTIQAANGTSQGRSVSPEEAAGMADYLENILMRHLERLRNYDLDGAMVLAEEANPLALAVAEAGALDAPSCAEQRGRIRKLYSEISLVIAAERQEVSEKLKTIRKGIKTLGAYIDR
ncbi:MAG: hypothetical protein IH624_00275 [Phycisphaerae bacterium]|nr:hypothetical protein [Phycisphaerae bacterium]